MIFCDWLTISQKHENAKPLAGLRTLSFREPGDINRDGEAVEVQDVIGEKAHWAWVQGSHDTKIRVVSHDGSVAVSGNPGRWGRPDNVFNHDFFDTVQAASRICEAQGLPAFQCGEPVQMETGSKCPASTLGDALRWSGARIWCVHLTRNYITGSAENARHVINWLDRQTVARVKKSRLGASTVAWGSLRYCQTEVYVKADEMLVHARSPEAKEAVKASKLYQWARDNGVVRVEVKAAKDYLKAKGLTYLGAWDMGTVTRIFEERTEVINRCRVDVEDLDLHSVEKKYRMAVAAWLRGEDVAALYNSRTTLWRHAKEIRGLGIDILERRNIETMPVRVRTIDLVSASVPSWYSWAA